MTALIYTVLRGTACAGKAIMQNFRILIQYRAFSGVQAAKDIDFLAGNVSESVGIRKISRGEIQEAVSARCIVESCFWRCGRR
jgi:hypothetical protein